MVREKVLELVLAILVMWENCALNAVPPDILKKLKTKHTSSALVSYVSEFAFLNFKIYVNFVCFDPFCLQICNFKTHMVRQCSMLILMFVLILESAVCVKIVLLVELTTGN